jgi:hypothetical protein
MASFNFLKQAQLYLVHNNKQYNIDVEEISFSQTFASDSYSVKTLHSQDMFEGTVINKANPVNFSFTMPALREDDLSIVMDRLIDYNTVDLYISTQQDVFKIRYAVFTNGSFVIEKSRPLSLQVSGEASELSKVGVFGDSPSSIPGVIQTRSGSRTFNQVDYLQITLGSSNISTEVYTLAVELQNSIEWTPYVTVQGALGATSASNSMFPTAFSVDKRSLAGSIERYISDTNSGDLQNWSNDVALRIEAGQKVGSILYGFDINMAHCSFTNRANVGGVFTQNYDWSMNYNPSSLSDVINYSTQ